VEPIPPLGDTNVSLTISGILSIKLSQTKSFPNAILMIFLKTQPIS
jgi:hypothetical protein